MNVGVINEQQLQKEVEKIKNQFEESKDIYREVCVLLFFRYGITPTANKLYQYVRRGSMSAPADALNKFWLELREKSRVRIERSDIPENIAVAAGDLIATLWNEAQNAAQAGFSELIDNATSEILQFKMQAENANQSTEKARHLLIESQAKLESALKRVSETDYLLSVNTETLTKQENAFNALRIEREQLSASIIDIKASFSKDLANITLALNKAEGRYRGLEEKSLLELDRSRQQIKKLEKEIISLRLKSSTEQSVYIKDILKLQTAIAALNHKTGNLSGVVSELKNQLKIERRQATVKSKPFSNKAKKAI